MLRTQSKISEINGAQAQHSHSLFFFYDNYCIKKNSIKVLTANVCSLLKLHSLGIKERPVCLSAYTLQSALQNSIFITDCVFNFMVKMSFFLFMSIPDYTATLFTLKHRLSSIN